jgi:hypothetical protein
MNRSFGKMPVSHDGNFEESSLNKPRTRAPQQQHQTSKMSNNRPQQLASAKKSMPTIAIAGTAALSLLLLLSISLSSQVNGQSAGGSCHLRELDLCAASMLVFTQAPNGLATNDAEINKQCVHLKEADGCLRNYTRRCMTPIQRELMTFAANSSFQLLDEYCTKGSNLRQSYLKHAQCLNQIQKRQEHKGCMRDLQASLELLTSNQLPASKQDLQKPTGRSSAGADGQGDLNGKRLQVACCAYRRFESCLGGQTEKRCGKETIQFVQSIMRRATSRLPEIVCRHYKPDGPECRALLPKNGVSPRGSKSNSIISRLLSAYSGL